MRFSIDGRRTRLEFEHRGWEQLGDLGMEKRKQYDAGWDEVLGKYMEAARGSDRD